MAFAVSLIRSTDLSTTVQYACPVKSREVVYRCPSG